MLQIIAWILLAITSFSMLARKTGVVFGFLFLASLVIGFISFGFLMGLGYSVLLIIGAVVFHILERILSMNTAGEIIKSDLKKKWDTQDKSKSENKTQRGRSAKIL